MILQTVLQFCVCLLALKWYRMKGNIQEEVEEMQEEQRSLSSIQTLSVYSLLRDRCVRWQVITIMVVNIGMQLSGIDAVSMKRFVRILTLLPFLQYMCVHMCVCVCAHILVVQRLCSYYVRMRAPMAIVPSCAPPICTSSWLYITVPHATVE